MAKRLHNEKNEKELNNENYMIKRLYNRNYMMKGYFNRRPI